MAGPTAKRDALRAMPPVYLLGRLAGLFRRLTPVGRAAAALTAAGLGLTAAAVGLRGLTRHLEF